MISIVTSRLDENEAVTGNVAILLSVLARLSVSSPAPSVNNTGLAPQDSPSWTVPSLDWGNCTEGCDVKVPEGANIQCARLSVPLNWNQPDGESISISMSRIPAKNQSAKLGSLLFNPGGPGGRGVSWMVDSISVPPQVYFSEEVREVYDTSKFSWFLDLFASSFGMGRRQ